MLNRVLFVYGTLRRGEPNHRWLGTAWFLCAHRTDARYTLLDLGAYPGAVAGGCTALSGELYTLNTALLARLDRLEDYPNEYTRGLIPTPYGKAWIYLYQHPVPAAASLIVSGDWRRRRRRWVRSLA